MYKLDLHMFDGGAAAGGAPAAGSTAQAGGTATQAGGTAVQTEGTQSGEQEDEQSNQLTPEEQRKADYKKFKEQYKDLYGEDVKKQVDRRFAPMNRMQQQLDSQGRLMQVVAAKYGTDASDVDGMINAINADSAYYEEKALEAGMPVEKYKEFMNLQAQNKAMEEAQRRAENLRQEEQTWARWDAETEQCKNLYPDFDIRFEIENNENFAKMLGAGCDVITAYRVTHFDDITQGLITRSEQETKKRVADTVRAGASRPVEGAAGSSPAAKSQMDIMGMSRAEFADLKKKVLSGEVSL